MLDFRLKAFKAWQKMKEPEWHNVEYPPIDYQDHRYYAEPKPKKKLDSMDDVDQNLNELLKSLEFH